MKTLAQQRSGKKQMTLPLHQNNDRLNVLWEEASNKVAISEMVHLFIGCIQTRKILCKQRTQWNHTSPNMAISNC